MNKINKFFGETKWLSNFYMSPVLYEDIWYPSVEHAYQAAKSLDPIDRVRFAKLDTPRQAKREGYKVQLRSDWEDIKIDVMYKCVQSKFNTTNELKEMLLNTGDAELIEGNPWGDIFWGVCNGEGRNELGKILMKVRNELSKTNN